MDTLDRMLVSADNALRTLSGSATAGRPSPTAAEATELSPKDRTLSGALMRVNHVGEVCAQALYQAQALTARDDGTRLRMQEAAREEMDHLAWTAQRLRELGDRPSRLDPLWYAGAFAIGLVAGRIGDATSLGFVVETERQVEQHLAGHLERLPPDDLRSRAIVAAMRDDEQRHGQAALSAGGAELPAPVRWAMRAAAKVMTTVAHRV
ncbi:MAG: 2-polyprenyl-3-methyl-6-methoxy-1,4-benzoquinone monooxygenase [Rubrivivax sp.]|nr:2-polyprenyl-3-methyl-6-methoxy-1,4-benzoquinone monooxygenase [Rubrivivax sp.]